jgi:hypothetical protein
LQGVLKIIRCLLIRASVRPVFAIILILAATSDGEEAKSDVAFVTYLEGVARVRKPGSEGWLKIEESAIILSGDSVKTLADSRAEIRFTDDNTVRIGSSTAIEIADSAEIALESGEIWMVVGQGSRILSMKIKSPVAIAEIREAVARFSVGQDGSTEIKVYDGQIDLKILPVIVEPESLTSDSMFYDVPGKDVFLEGNDKIIITSSGEIAFQGAFSTDDVDEDIEWVRWNKNRDQTGGGSDY